MKRLTRAASLFIFGTILVGFALAFNEFVGSQFPSLAVFSVALLAGIAQIFKVEGSTFNSNYNIGWIMYGFSIVLFSPADTLFIIIFSHLIEGLWHRHPWFIQFFNVASNILAVIIASLVSLAMMTETPGFSTQEVFRLCVSLAVFTFFNQLMVGLMIYFSRRKNLGESGVFSFLTMMINYTLIALGGAAAILWLLTPLASLFAIIPIYFVYITMRVPALERQTEIDPKTKLYNSNFFRESFEKELNRAKRFDRPLTVVMADMDLLRDINNTYGHVAGDVVLVGVANLFKKHFRGYDIVARYGGEEFVVLLPETAPKDAFPRVEVLRKDIEASGFEISTSVTPIQATMSFGISARTEQYQTMDEIIHNADMALYHSKGEGRNRVMIHSEEGLEEFFGLNQENGKESLPQQKRKTGRVQGLESKLTPKFRVPASADLKTIPSPIRNAVLYKWKINGFVILVALLAATITVLALSFQSSIDWFGLALFSLILFTAEGLKLDIIAKDGSVSTSVAPFIGAVLLFGPWAAIVVSFLLAVSDYLKKKTPFPRLFFNFSNHLIGGVVVAILVKSFVVPFANLPLLTQFALAVLGGAIMFFSSTMFRSGLIGITLLKPILTVWTENFRWLLLYYLVFGAAGYALAFGYINGGVVGMMAMILPMLIFRFSQAQYVSRTESLVEGLHVQIQELTFDKREFSTENEELLACLAKAIDIREDTAFGHSEIASHYAVQIGRELGLSKTRLNVLRKAGMLHDIGKIKIPDTILLKPGNLTSKEYEKIKEHPRVGAGLLGQSRSMQNLIPAVLHHHERWDGTGYPDKLKGEQIPLEARIIGLADAVEAMASDRPYRKAYSFEEIKREVVKNSGSQFDPTVVQALLKIVAREGKGFLRISAAHKITNHFS